jgi:hypothetical protein
VERAREAVARGAAPAVLRPPRDLEELEGVFFGADFLVVARVRGVARLRAVVPFRAVLRFRDDAREPLFFERPDRPADPEVFREPPRPLFAFLATVNLPVEPV